MWRTICRPASVIGVFAVLVLGGCGGGEQETSAGGLGTTPPTSGAPTTAMTLPATTTVAAAGTPLRCANVAFSSNTEDVASDIRSTGMNCTEAEAFVRKIGPQMTSVDGPTRVETDGFACIRTSLRSGDHGAPLATFDCTNGATKVVFVRALLT